MSIGNRTRDLRKAKGWNQSELAEKLGMTSGGLSNLEKDKSKASQEIIIKLSEIFEVSTDFLLTGKESTNEISPEEREIIEILRKDDALTSAIKEAAELKKKVIRRIRMAIEPERLAA